MKMMMPTGIGAAASAHHAPADADGAARSDDGHSGSAIATIVTAIGHLPIAIAPRRRSARPPGRLCRVRNYGCRQRAAASMPPTRRSLIRQGYALGGGRVPAPLSWSQGEEKS